MRAALVLIVALCFISPSIAYDVNRVVLSAQEALIRLGYNPGPADGDWGGKTRDALNLLREMQGLPPADELAGSSVALLHKLSPGETTLPNPGFMFTDIPGRQAFLSSSENAQIRSAQCPTRIGANLPLDSVEPVPRLEMIVKKQSYISMEEDWYGNILESLHATTNGCLGGDAGKCRSVVDFATRWAEADALQPVLQRGHDQYAQTIWIGNVVMRGTMVAYGIVRQVAEVSPVQEATIFDWFKRRVDDYHYYRPDQATQNHALANMSPALIFGVLSGDHTMMEPALEAWRIALDSMRPDGSFPREARRGARWALYTTLQISQLLMVAELAAGQEIDVYATSPSPEKTVQHAVGWLLDSLENFEVGWPYAKENSGSPGDYHIPYFDVYHYGWIPAYHSRFGNDETMMRMKSATVDPRICSQEATEEEKTYPPTCRSFSGEPVSFAKSLQAMGPVPSALMGYAAGCVQGLGTSPFAD